MKFTVVYRIAAGVSTIDLEGVRHIQERGGMIYFYEGDGGLERLLFGTAVENIVFIQPVPTTKESSVVAPPRAPEAAS